MKINILIVEDDPAMRVILRSTVKNAGLEIEIGEIFEAENGDEGLKVLEKEKIGLMLVDIYMPVMDGLEMLDYARDNPDWSHIPAIVVSSENNEDRIDAILRQGMGFVHKPLTHLLLKDRIKEMIQKKMIKED
ncbi:MAG: two-component system response regulator [Balneola sp.]|jgi:two-component system chemotaxis response regulator CheY|nr:two-component system response regulator [Balneola sp.]MBE79152.1 two-component system response regulator [Balneola sp.]HBX66446.1 response regulator [Balneolaceae bacterium]|tara:strand:- start:258 stop:656 length:399 start_codon:yes stop_codon:yes gene_type:complete